MKYDPSPIDEWLANDAQQLKRAAVPLHDAIAGVKALLDPALELPHREYLAQQGQQQVVEMAVEVLNAFDRWSETHSLVSFALEGQELTKQLHLVHRQLAEARTLPFTPSYQAQVRILYQRARECDKDFQRCYDQGRRDLRYLLRNATADSAELSTRLPQLSLDKFLDTYGCKPLLEDLVDQDRGILTNTFTMLHECRRAFFNNDLLVVATTLKGIEDMTKRIAADAAAAYKAAQQSSLQFVYDTPYAEQRPVQSKKALATILENIMRESQSYNVHRET